MNWIECVSIHDYLISTDYPHYIRHKSRNTFRVDNVESKTQRLIIMVRGKKYYNDELIAKQFIPNPENKTKVKHINGDTLDNHIQNLQWDD